MMQMNFLSSKGGWNDNNQYFLWPVGEKNVSKIHINIGRKAEKVETRNW